MNVESDGSFKPGHTNWYKIKQVWFLLCKLLFLCSRMAGMQMIIT